MLYLSGKKGKEFAITDTDDNTTEYATLEYLMTLKIAIAGLYPDKIIQVEPPNKIKDRFLNGDFRFGLKRCPYYYKFTMTFLPRRRKKFSTENSEKEYFWFKRVGWDTYEYYDFTCGRLLKLSREEMIDRLEYYNETMVFQKDAITITV